MSKKKAKKRTRRKTKVPVAILGPVVRKKVSSNLSTPRQSPNHGFGAEA